MQKFDQFERFMHVIGYQCRICESVQAGIEARPDPLHSLFERPGTDDLVVHLFTVRIKRRLHMSQPCSRKLPGQPVSPQQPTISIDPRYLSQLLCMLDQSWKALI